MRCALQDRLQIAAGDFLGALGDGWNPSATSAKRRQGENDVRHEKAKIVGRLAALLKKKRYFIEWEGALADTTRLFSTRRF